MDKNLKPVPKGKKGKGLSKLPKKVRNNMGYMKDGGRVMKKDGGRIQIQGFGKARH